MPRQHEEGWECPECHLKRGPDLHDPCIGYLPGVRYACCGHGGRSLSGSYDGYIFFENGTVIRFEKLTCRYTNQFFYQEAMS
jgi:hypothetical protein